MDVYFDLDGEEIYDIRTGGTIKYIDDLDDDDLKGILEG